jgi:putative membrane-bound dehydrogenase-like protein
MPKDDVANNLGERVGERGRTSSQARSVFQKFCAGTILILLLAAEPQLLVAQGFTSKTAASKMKLADGLVVKLFASEPEIRQPILVKMDDRGRLWTIQYLQYPNPAGLKRVNVDRWSRTVYDRVPKPPPLGPKGADRITILEDTDGDGRADRFKDFVSGLNLATGLAFGHGGVFVIQVPYLLFYPDRNRDDIPDSKPEVLLTGFGMQDAQSLANHLTWGPDGWLYGVNGSTTTCNIRGIEFQQGCWRYHPVSKEFELFCEGGGNTFGVTFDENGNLFYSTNGGPFVHALQGAYYYKSFGKHGPLHNPFAYGFFGHVDRDVVPGGPPTGGTIYLADAFPARLRGTFISGNFLGHTCSWWNIKPTRTTVTAKLGGVLLDSRDSWFGPTDMCVGADGAMYVSDFHDRRTAHPDPDAKWDRSNGRIFRIEARKMAPASRVDLDSKSSRELVALLRHRNSWYADRARVLLAGRRDASIVPALRQMALQSKNANVALQGLWALNVTAGLNDDVALELLDHSYEYVRSWTVRLLGDNKHVSPVVQRKLAQLADSDPSSIVRLQLAATAKRLPAQHALPIIKHILSRDLDDADPRIPMLLWWAIEAKAISDHELVLQDFAKLAAWKIASNRGNIRRLLRRYAAEGTKLGYRACMRLLITTPASQRDSMHQALAQGLAERSVGLPGIEQGGLFEQYATVKALPKTPQPKRFEPLTDELRQYVDDLWRASKSNAFLLRLALRCNVDAAYKFVLAQLPSSTGANRLLFVDVMGEFGRASCFPYLLVFVTKAQPEKVVAAVIDALDRLDTQLSQVSFNAYTGFLLNIYTDASPNLRSKCRDTLLSRAESARAFLRLVDQNQISAAEVPIEQLRTISLHDDAELNSLVRKHWGNIMPGTTEEKLATMRRFNNDLRVGGGNAISGKTVFKTQCAICHKLFGEGNQVGPDLTKANRGDRAALLANLVDPSAVIRREFMSYVVETKSGRVLTGLIATQNAAEIILLDAKNKRTPIARNRIEVIRESPVSLMPEKILDQLKPQELRDLFAYLKSARGATVLQTPK